MHLDHLDSQVRLDLLEGLDLQGNQVRLDHLD